jgi:uncharacterized membrane protein YfcA
MASTLLTSLAGFVTFMFLSEHHHGMFLSEHHHGPIAPAWAVGIALGAGGLIGGYPGAFAQPHLPEILVCRVLGLLAIAIAIRYAWLAGHL